MSKIILKNGFLIALIGLLPSVSQADIIDGRYSSAQVFDAQRSPPFPNNGVSQTYSNFKAPLKDDRSPLTLSAGDTVRIFYVGGSCSNDEVGLKRFDSSGAEIETISLSGKVYGLAPEGFLYVSDNGDIGTYFSNDRAEELGGSRTFTPTSGDGTSNGNNTCLELAAYAANSTPQTVSSNNDSSSNTPTPVNIQTSVSRLQTTVVFNNIASRLQNIGSPVGVSRGSSSGVGRSTPGGDAVNTPSTGGAGGATGTPDDGTNFANFSNDDLLDADSWHNDQSYTESGWKTEGFWRELAMKASFDSSQNPNFLGLVLGQNQGVDTIFDGQQQRFDQLPADRPWTIWGQGSFTSAENSINDGISDARFDGDVWGYNVGLDYQLNTEIYVGVSLGMADTDLDTLYNAGKYEETNYSVTPYMVLQATDQLKVSVLGGYSLGDIDTNRSNNAITGDTTSTMWFGSVTASYTFRPEVGTPLDVTGSLGLNGSRKTVASYTESDGTFVARTKARTIQLKPGFEVAYAFQNGDNVIQPFVKMDMLYDHAGSINEDDISYDLGGGVRLGNNVQGISGSVDFTRNIGRNDYKKHSFSGAIAYGFSMQQLGFGPAGFVAPFIEAQADDDTRGVATGVKYNAMDGATALVLELSHDRASTVTETDTSAVLFTADFKF